MYMKRNIDKKMNRCYHSSIGFANFKNCFKTVGDLNENNKNIYCFFSDNIWISYEFVL